MSTALWWIRRDLRLADNQALASALAAADQIVPVFVIDPKLWDAQPATNRQAFLLAGLRQLDADLCARGSRLILRRGDPHEALAQLAAETGASAVCAERDYSPYAHRRDERVARDLPLRLVESLTVHPPSAVLKSDGKPYTVFTPFSRAWKARTPPSPALVLSPPARMVTPPDIASEAWPSGSGLPVSVPCLPGQVQAQHRLDLFVNRDDPRIYRYGEGRNRLDEDGTSLLSPYLRFGMLSARQAAIAAYRAIESAPNAVARKSAETWLNELIWREFYVSILHHFPHVLDQAFRADLRAIPWRNDEREFAAWRGGRTGYPVVDAALRQLAETGWMHNRARMIAASFLVKDLLIDWRWGERWFMQHLVDGDPASNNGGWQWTAGVGTDAAPYFRVFNPVLQGKKFDPQGGYVRRWLPELARVPLKFIHAPWEMPIEVQRAAECVIGQHYPAPIVDHAQARERVLAAYRRAE
jgi:deoxyribodipyrimidine photo-lyase